MPKTGVARSICFVSALALAVGSLAAIEVWYSYRDATSAAERWTEGLVRLLAEQTERTIQAIDLTLLGMRDALLVAPSISSNDPAYQAALTDRLKSSLMCGGYSWLGKTASPRTTQTIQQPPE
jgi:hypothetical protein